MRLTPLEAILNRNISGAARARQLSAQLEGRVLALRATGAPVNLYFSVMAERITLSTDYEGVPHATLSGTPLALLRLVGPSPESALRMRSVHIEGDAEIAQRFSELLEEARPDFEEELSRVIGDFAAHQVGNVARGALDFARRASDAFTQNVAEYFQEESRDLPNRTEADEFIAGVDDLRESVDRLEVRIALLEKRLALRG